MFVTNARFIAGGQYKRVAKLGAWPDRIDAEASIMKRIPGVGKTASGFDAGVACCLNLIPRRKQRLSAILHAAYTEEAVEQVRREVEVFDWDPDFETVWWLAACHVCKETGVSEEEFEAQIFRFRLAMNNPDIRLDFARYAYGHMISIYETDTLDGIPFGREDGCIQGGFVSGHPVGVERADKHDLFFIGTYYPSLGLENFVWSDEVDEELGPRSGPVHGSAQYVKCATWDEMRRALGVVRRHLGRYQNFR